ncbi:MAG TPA: SDR family oxidoreductase [bacterium]|nr:SDR family oxidoreductase [bacterium]
MIAVTGASGKLGRLVIEGLLEKIAPEKIVAVVRNPEKVKDFAARGVQVRHGDYSSPETLPPALAGVERLLLISSSEVGRRAAQHGAVVDAAKGANVKLIAYTSILRADTSALLLAGEHKATEKMIRATGLPFAFLRNGWYIENYTENLAPVLTHGALPGASGDGRVAAATRADFAAAAVAVLTGENHENKIYELAGDQGFSMSEFVAAVSAWAGKPIVYQELPPEVYKQMLVGAGLPEPFAAILVDASAGVAKGELDSDRRDLHDLLGRDTQTLADVLAALPKP